MPFFRQTADLGHKLAESITVTNTHISQNLCTVIYNVYVFVFTMISSPVKMISQKFPFGVMSNSTTRRRQDVFLHFLLFF